MRVYFIQSVNNTKKHSLGAYEYLFSIEDKDLDNLDT